VIEIIFQYTKINDFLEQRFRFKGAGVGAIKGKWAAPEPESELRSFENLAPEQESEPLTFSRLHQPCLQRWTALDRSATAALC